MFEENDVVPRGPQWLYLSDQHPQALVESKTDARGTGARGDGPAQS